MQLLKKRGILIFWFVLVLDCYFIYTGQELFRIATKTALVPILLFYIFLNARKNYYKNAKTFIFLAFIAAWLGDILLLNKGNTFFLLGMLAFMCAHILFALTFYRIHKLQIFKAQESFIAALILIFLCFELYKFITPGLADFFKIPVIIYMVAISIMVITVANLLNSSARKTSAMMYFLPGAALFVISDALLALQTFMFSDIDLLSISVMLSYGYALSLFSDGFSKLLKG